MGYKGLLPARSSGTGGKPICSGRRSQTWEFILEPQERLKYIDIPGAETDYFNRYG